MNHGNQAGSSKKTWNKSVMWVTNDSLEVAQSALIESGAIGLEVIDGIGPEGQRAFLDDQIQLIGYFDAASNLDEIIHQVERFFVECQLPVPKIEFVSFHEENWQQNFVKSCTTFKVEPDIYIVPSFEIEAFKKAPRGSLYIEMDPENAFGTGQHQTTKLCLTALHRYVDPQKHLMGLDVGTGSGILAILMKKLGMPSVRASEVDADALKTAEKNAVRNGVIVENFVVNEDHQYEHHAYDVVIANILAPVLIAMVENLTTTLKDGVLILSGILVSQKEDVIAAYMQHNLELVEAAVLDDWCALVFVRQSVSLRSSSERA